MPFTRYMVTGKLEWEAHLPQDTLMSAQITQLNPYLPSGNSSIGHSSVSRMKIEFTKYQGTNNGLVTCSQAQ